MTASPAPLSIGLISGEFPPMQGGVGAFTRELARELSAQGQTVHVITHREARPEQPRPRFAALQEPADLGYAKLHARARRWNWGDVGRIADIAIRYDLDLLNIQFQPAAYNMRNPAIYFAPWRLRGICPVVVTFHDLRVPFLFPKAGRLRRRIVQFLAQSASAAIATNGADFEQLRAWRGDERVRQVPIGSNVAVHPAGAAKTAELRARLGVPAEGCLLAYFGFLNESKGGDTLVRALAELEEQYHLVFVGGRTGASDSANNRAFMERLDGLIRAAGLGERVHWSGFVPDAEVSRYLFAADIVVLPYRDGVSLRRGTLMAALAHGRPVISTTPPQPVPELQHGENIWLVLPDDAAALAEAIRTLATAGELRRKIGVAAQETAGQFTWDKIAGQTLDFYRTLVQ